jgi:UDPglucose 6-dehydrogenase
VCRELLDEHADVVLCDPHALENARADLGALASRVNFELDPYHAAQGAHAIAVLTEWEDFAALDFQRIFDTMAHPAFIFDGRNILDHQALFEMGFNVYAVGKEPRVKFNDISSKVKAER